MAAQTSFSITTVAHEDLVDVCTILDSFQTPLFSSSPKIRATDVVHSWTLDTLVAVQSAHAADASAFNNAWPAQTAPARLNNAVVTFSNNIEVGDQARAINPAGIRDFYDHQVMKSFKQIARDCEWWLFSTAASASSEASAVAHAASAYGMFGFPMIVSNAPGGVATADIIRISESLFNAGAEPDSMWFAPSQKRQFVTAVGGTTINSRNIAAADKAMIQNVDVYESPFNQLYAVITDRFIPTATASATGYGYFIGDRAMAKIAFLRPPQHKPMGKAGDSTRGIVLMDLTLQLDHPSAWGRVTGCTNG